MIRKAFKMSVHEDQQAEYARRHRPIWRELEETLDDSPVSTELREVFHIGRRS
jgi:L-rhamnose mutarotase